MKGTWFQQPFLELSLFPASFFIHPSFGLESVWNLHRTSLVDHGICMRAPAMVVSIYTGAVMCRCGCYLEDGALIRGQKSSWIMVVWCLVSPEKIPGVGVVILPNGRTPWLFIDGGDPDVPFLGAHPPNEGTATAPKLDRASKSIISFKSMAVLVPIYTRW